MDAHVVVERDEGGDGHVDGHGAGRGDGGRDQAQQADADDALQLPVRLARRVGGRGNRHAPHCVCTQL